MASLNQPNPRRPIGPTLRWAKPRNTTATGTGSQSAKIPVRFDLDANTDSPALGSDQPSDNTGVRSEEDRPSRFSAAGQTRTDPSRWPSRPGESFGQTVRHNLSEFADSAWDYYSAGRSATGGGDASDHHGEAARPSYNASTADESTVRQADANRGLSTWQLLVPFAVAGIFLLVAFLTLLD